MDPTTAQQLSTAIGLALGGILPDLNQLLKDYKISEVLELKTDIDPLMLNSNAVSCCVINRVLVCNCTGPTYGLSASSDNTLGLDPMKTQQFCQAVASKLAQIMPGINKFIQGSKDSFEVHLLLDPATVVTSQQPMTCVWNTGNILQCSEP